MIVTTRQRIDEEARVRFETRVHLALTRAFHDWRTQLLVAAEAAGALPEAFWEQEEAYLARVLIPFFEDGLRIGVEAERPRFVEQGVVVEPRLRETAARLAHDLAQQMTATTARRVEDLLDAWTTRAQPLEVLRQQLESGPLGERYAELLAVTETTRAIAAGQLVVWRAHRPPSKTVSPPDVPAFVVGKRWRVRADERTCPICAPLSSPSSAGS